MNRFTFLLIVCLVLTGTNSYAQNNGGAGGGQGAGGGGGQFGGGAGGGQGGFPGGIIIDAEGLINAPQGQQINPSLQKRKLQIFAGQHLEPGLNSVSELRKVSLNRLDAQLKLAVESEQAPSFEVQHLGGLTSIEYVLFDEANNDVILAGPAEGFAASTGGRVIGVSTGRPTLKLDDLLVTLRMTSDNQQLGCSFDPEPSRLAEANAWSKANSSPSSLAVARQRFFQMAEILGTWNVTVFGLPNDCHAALTAVEADYDLKRLALGIAKPNIRRFYSHLHFARPGENTMRRWWLAPRYNVIEKTADDTIFHLSGPRLQLMSQEELVDQQGNRSNAAFTEVSAEKYTKQFNKHINSLCNQAPSFAATQNLFDLAVVSALIRRANTNGQINWQPDVLMNKNALPHQSYSTPTQVPSLVNVKASGRSLLIGLVGGGVTIVPNNIINRMNELEATKVPETLTAAVTATNWYWD